MTRILVVVVLIALTSLIRSSTTSSTSQPHPLFNQFDLSLKPCPAACEGNGGNCDGERGVCSCPWPRTGPACEVDRLSHCYDGPEVTVPSCGSWSPKNCECYKQCQE